MYSIEFESDLIKGVKLIDIELLNPHEKIIERKIAILHQMDTKEILKELLYQEVLLKNKRN